MASNHPVAPNDSPENRAKNRRVTITILTPQSEHVVINNIFEEGK
jgi:chemotaxis protein MotB